MATYKVLSTKKLLSTLVEAAKGSEIELTEQEFISVCPIWTKEKVKEVLDIISAGKAGNVVFTSANAVTPFEQYLHQFDTYYVVDWQIYCLSGRTMEAIRKAWYFQKNIVDSAPNAKELAEKIIASGVRELVFFCGDKRREELPELLSKAAIKVHEVVVYETIPTPVVATEDLNGILF